MIRVVEDCCMEKAAVSCVIRVVEDCCMEKAAVSCVIRVVEDCTTLITEDTAVWRRQLYLV